MSLLYIYYSLLYIQLYLSLRRLPLAPLVACAVSLRLLGCSVGTVNEEEVLDRIHELTFHISSDVLNCPAWLHKSNNCFLSSNNNNKNSNCCRNCIGAFYLKLEFIFINSCESLFDVIALWIANYYVLIYTCVHLRNL